MYKDPIASKQANDVASMRVNQKIDEVSAKVADPEQSDADFTANLLDLCVLNRMADSHQVCRKGAA